MNRNQRFTAADVAIARFLWDARGFTPDDFQLGSESAEMVEELLEAAFEMNSAKHLSFNDIK